MLTPITALLTGVTAPEWPSEARAAALSRLRDELLGPIYGQVSLPNGIVERVFAHGEQPLRVIQRDDDSALIERYEFGGALEAPEDAKGDWQSYSTHDTVREALIAARAIYPVPSRDDVMARWAPDGAAALTLDALTQQMGSIDKLAAFYYDIKALSAGDQMGFVADAPDALWPLIKVAHATFEFGLTAGGPFDLTRDPVASDLNQSLKRQWEDNLLTEQVRLEAPDAFGTFVDGSLVCHDWNTGDQLGINYQGLVSIDQQLWVIGESFGQYDQQGKPVLEQSYTPLGFGHAPADVLRARDRMEGIRSMEAAMNELRAGDHITYHYIKSPTVSSWGPNGGVMGLDYQLKITVMPRPETGVFASGDPVLVLRIPPFHDIFTGIHAHANAHGIKTYDIDEYGITPEGLTQRYHEGALIAPAQLLPPRGERPPLTPQHYEAVVRRNYELQGAYVRATEAAKQTAQHMLARDPQTGRTLTELRDEIQRDTVLLKSSPLWRDDFEQPEPHPRHWGVLIQHTAEMQQDLLDPQRLFSPDVSAQIMKFIEHNIARLNAQVLDPALPGNECLKDLQVADVARLLNQRQVVSPADEATRQVALSAGMVEDGNKVIATEKGRAWLVANGFLLNSPERLFDDQRMRLGQHRVEVMASERNDGTLSDWAASEQGDWRYAEWTPAGANQSLPIGVSVAGVISVDRNPWSPSGEAIVSLRQLSEALAEAEPRAMPIKLDYAEIASTILKQLGGGKFIVMTGAKNMVSLSTPRFGGLELSLPSRFAKDGINRVRITVNEHDTYDVSFSKIRGLTIKTVAEVFGVYAGDLPGVFTSHTGLETSMGIIKAAVAPAWREEIRQAADFESLHTVANRILAAKQQPLMPASGAFSSDAYHVWGSACEAGSELASLLVACENRAVAFEAREAAIEAQVAAERDALRRAVEPVNDPLTEIPDAGDSESPRVAYEVSVTYSRWTEADREAGQSDDQGQHLEGDLYDAEALQRLARELDITAPSASSPPSNNTVFYQNETPPEDRAHFEEGIDTYYNLHIHTVNGRSPTALDHQAIADLIGVTYQHPLIEQKDDEARLECS